jgi:hypothetical protein
MRSTLSLILCGMFGVAALPLPALAQGNPYAPMVTTPPGPQNPVNLNQEDPGTQMITPPAFTNNDGMPAPSSDGIAQGPVATPSTSPGMVFSGLGSAPGIGAGGLSVVPGGVH